MATNPFDQFDAPAVNPFDQFDAAPAATGGIPGPRRSWSDVAKEAYTNAPSSLKNLYVGMAQAITSPVQTAQGLLDVGAGALQNITPTIVRDFINQFDTNPAAAKRAVEAANAVGGEYANRYGSIEGFKNALATDPAAVAADFSTLMTGGAGLTARAAPAVSKTMATAGRLTNPLAPIGMAVNVAKYPLGAVGNVAEAMFNPKNALYMRAAEGQAPAIINALRGAQEIVPGSVPTAAQAAADTGVVGFQKMGKSAAGVLETEYKGREAAQKAAQLQAVQNVGKTPAELEAAIKARGDEAARLYGISDEAVLPGRERQFKSVQAGTVKSGVPLIDPITGQPKMMPVSETAPATSAAGKRQVQVEVGRDSFNQPVYETRTVPTTVLKGGGEPARDFLTNVPKLEQEISTGGQPIYKQIANGYKYDSQLSDLMKRPAVQAAIDNAGVIAANRGVALFDAEGKLTGSGAHLIKLALDDMLTPSPTTPLAKNIASAIESAKNTYVNWVEKNVPAYKQARESFAAASKPIDQMQVGQFLESKLTPALGEETARLRAAGYATALEQAPQTIKKATGASRYSTLEQVFEKDPEALKALHAVRDDLARQAKSERLSTGPIKKEVDVTRAAEAIAGETALPNMINRVTTVANDIWRRLRGRIDQSVAIEVAQEMLFPGKAADALEAALRQQTRRQAIAAAAAAPAKAAYVTPAIANMLAPAQENRNALAR